MTSNLTLDMSSAPDELTRSPWPEPGDVYSKAGGQPGFWAVISVTRAGSCYVLAFDLEGQITGANAYRASYFAENRSRKVGRVELPTFAVIWDAPK